MPSSSLARRPLLLHLPRFSSFFLPSLLLLLRLSSAYGAAVGSSSSSIQLTSFTKNESSKGDIAQLWFTLLNQGEAAIAGLRLEVRLPLRHVSYREASVFPPLEEGDEVGASQATPLLLVEEEEEEEVEQEGGEEWLFVVWPHVSLAAGQSRVFNIDAKVEEIQEGMPLHFDATVFGPSDGDAAADDHLLPSLATCMVTISKRPRITKESLREKQLQKQDASAPPPLPWLAFDNCKTPFVDDEAILLGEGEDCLASCHAHRSECIACGYDEVARGCLCHRRNAEGERQEGEKAEKRYLTIYTHADTEQEEEEEDAGTFTAIPSLGRRAEIMVFPSLLSEEQCVSMDNYLADLVAIHQIERKIIEEPDSRLHRLIYDLLPIPGVDYKEYVTFSEENIEVDPHYDQVKGGETHKVLLFLDDVAGTRFWQTKEAYEKNRCPLLVPPARGTVVIFPMALYHDSARYEPQGSIKKTLGLRISLPPFEGTGAMALIDTAAAAGGGTMSVER